MAELVDRAKREGARREDFQVNDLVSIVPMMSRLALGLPPDAGTTTTNSTTNLFRPVRDSQVVTATSQPVHGGRSLVVVCTDLTDDQGRLVAQTVQSQAVVATSGPTTQ